MHSVPVTVGFMESFRIEVQSRIQSAGASAQGGRGGGRPPKKNWDGGGAPLPQTKKHRKAQKSDESALRAKEVIYYQCVTGVTRPPPIKIWCRRPWSAPLLTVPRQSGSFIIRCKIARNESALYNTRTYLNFTICSPV